MTYRKLFPAWMSIVLFMTGCATYPSLTSIPEYEPLKKSFNTASPLYLYPHAGQEWLESMLRQEFAKNGYTGVLGELPVQQRSPLDAKVVVPLDYMQKVIPQQDGFYLEVRIIVMVRQPGVVTTGSLSTPPEKRFFQAWSRIHLKQRFANQKELVECRQRAVSNLFMIEEFRKSLEPNADSTRLKELELAAEKGDKEALARLLAFHRKRPLSTGLPEAVRWAQLALLKGNDSGAELLVDNIGSDFFSTDEIRAEVAQRLIKAGHPEVCYRLGQYYEKRSKKEEAFKYYRMGAEKGMADAKYELAQCYYSGYGVKKDVPAALSWGKSSAEQGNMAAVNFIGIIYLNGKDIPADKPKAFRCFQKAAKMGLPIAYNNLGVCYEDGHGTAVDLEKAEACYMEASKRGDASGASNLKRLRKARQNAR